MKNLIYFWWALADENPELMNDIKGNIDFLQYREDVMLTREKIQKGLLKQPQSAPTARMEYDDAVSAYNSSSIKYEEVKDRYNKSLDDCSC